MWNYEVEFFFFWWILWSIISPPNKVMTYKFERSGFDDLIKKEKWWQQQLTIYPFKYSNYVHVKPWSPFARQIPNR